MARRPGGHEIVLALNGRFADTVDSAKRQFEGLIDPQNIHVWYPPPFAAASSPGSLRAREKLYEAFMASLQPDAVYVSSLFEGFGDASVTSIGSFAQLATAVTLYDLIPLIYSSTYLGDPEMRSWYMRKLGSLRRADMWLAISESSRQEGLYHLGLDPDRCLNISTAAYDHFRRVTVTAEREQALRIRHGLHKPFVMYTGGIDPRKNLEGLIRAFALLPSELRTALQLAIVCSAGAEDRASLLQLARERHLDEGAVVITGFVPEQDLVELYNLCRLFVFPSWHEGFGLPALEAMHCGAVVIGANASSLPEVIGRADALFDPRNDEDIARSMVQALTDDAFRTQMVEHGLAQARRFSWELSATRAIEGFERLHASTHRSAPPSHGLRGHRPRLAYVSPLPPERSGIASYSADLLPELAQHYEIELITSLKVVEDPALASSFATRDIEWFRNHSHAYDRVLYHFGNSEFHEHMFDLLAEIPGTVMLHDFFLSSVRARQEGLGLGTFEWSKALYESHGYAAVAERFRAADAADAVFRYPCNFDVLAQAQGVIVHSPHSFELGREWYGLSTTRDWALVPHLRVPPVDVASERSRARAELGLAPEGFLVCAFGLMGPTKLNHRLIDAWLASDLSRDSHCRLVFVGDKDPGAYGHEIDRRLQASGQQGRVEITGWASAELFARYLAAADLAVQLRTHSRGETSGTVLDAMSRGVATVVNANGSMAYLPQDAVAMLPDEFTDAQLTSALEDFLQDAPARNALGAQARRSVESLHSPGVCAQLYAEAIERFAAGAAVGRDGLLQAVAGGDPLPQDAGQGREIADLAATIADTLPMPMPKRQLLVDVSELVQRDSRSGIQRVVKSLLKALLAEPPAGFRIEPVYAEVDGPPGYRYARRFTMAFMGCPAEALTDAPIDMRRGDVFVGLDFQPHLIPQQAAFYRTMRHHGVRVNFVVYDLLPLQIGHRFPKGAPEAHERWLQAVAENDGAICISASVAAELSKWLTEHAPERMAAGFQVQSFHLGADLAASMHSKGLPRDAESTVRAISSAPSFLMVGTLEPRKGHVLALDAFERLWAEGVQVNLVIVGKKGWLADAMSTRLRRHPELGKRLFWIQKASDEYLEALYATASCLLAGSEGEGFGLPLIEAAIHKLPILANDLPVFREVAGGHATYFQSDAGALAAAIVEWLALFAQGRHPRSNTMPYLDWRQSADQFKARLTDCPTSAAAGLPLRPPGLPASRAPQNGAPAIVESIGHSDRFNQEPESNL
ncbi:glycosyltransferase [Variovorax sp. J22R115]|uniref:glycosyltransferase n=1 Tax=Variovorax sp. J22R115 TaxID=3053509 RepID=UPI002578C34C|nr:glycosyltransferase [Variovorax sp. J22R115]MDM0049028.1 glycosyltransferase [Variovorax sp. J22R115]